MKSSRFTSAARHCSPTAAVTRRNWPTPKPPRRVGLKPYYLGDTSALTRLPQPSVAARLAPLLESGLVARCSPTDLEAGFSSTSPAGHLAMRTFRSAWPFISTDQFALDRAVEVQDVLAARSQQRGAKIGDLLIAAAAEAARTLCSTTTVNLTSLPTSPASPRSGSCRRAPFPDFVADLVPRPGHRQPETVSCHLPQALPTGVVRHLPRDAPANRTLWTHPGRGER